MKQPLTHCVLLLGLGLLACGRIKSGDLLADDPQVRNEAFGNLAAASTANKKRLLPDLVAALKHENSNVVQRASEALSVLGGIAVPQLSQALKDEDPFVRLNAAYALGKAGVDTVPALPALEQAAADQHPLVREEAIVAIGNLGPAATAVVPSLINRLNDENEDVRREAASALIKIGTPEAKLAVEQAAAKAARNKPKKTPPKPNRAAKS